ncbi:HAD family hydrolase [Paenibacillus arenilitoris]|uniref:HAD family hydrolase n=1 Tax=Paenibacillus arenilitoris TaxID=2772299 RepID=A0A927H4S6_9BACL|nr:HAD family hydrolase [Paenibacillus arenilitoris]MBD2868190.1 HAD family hydrolase [Paenibacillus arenilitoris]
MDTSIQTGGDEMRPKAVLLDLDDTIIAFEQGVDLDACWRNVCGTHLPGSSVGEIGGLVGKIKERAKRYWSDEERHRVGRLDLDKARTEIVTSALGSDAGIDAAAAARIAIDYGRERDEAVVLHPGAIDAIAHIRSLGIKLALITNGASAAQRRKIERFRLGELFDHIYIEEEFGVGKPDPRIYLHAVDKLGALPEEAWMVGDNYKWEVVAPQAIGIRGVWINPQGIDPGTVHSVQPYRSIRTLGNIRKLLD